MSSSVTDIGKSEMEKTHGLSRQAKSLFFVGWILVCVGAIANEWVLAKTVSSDGTLQFETIIIIWFLDFTLILAGSFLINSRKLTHLTRVTLALGQSYPRTLSLGIGVVTAILTLLWTEAAFFALNNYKQRKVPRIEYSNSGRLFRVTDELLGFKHLANVQVSSIKKVDRKIAYNATYSTDAYGRRTTPATHLEPPSNFILFFGDSFTFGEGVNDNETLPFYVGQMASKYRVYNYGVMGYGPQGMLAELRDGDIAKEINETHGISIYTFIDDHISRAIGAQHVVAGWGWRMPFYHVDSSNRLVRRSNFISGRPGLTFLYWVLAKSQIAKYLGIHLPLRIDDSHIKTTARIIEESRNTFKEKFNSDRFYVLFFPGSRRAKNLIPYLESADIKYLDYSELIDMHEQEFHIENDPHPTPRAYKIVATRITKDIKILDSDQEK